MPDQDQKELEEIQQEQEMWGGCNNCQGEHCPDCN
jgi:hypothetical protein